MLRKYFRSSFRSTSSIRNWMMCRCELTASWTSRRTCSELFECAEKTRTMILLSWMARVISPANERPACTSRGATQQRIPPFSRAAHTASETTLSLVECEMKTSCAIASGRCLTFRRVRRNALFRWIERSVARW